MTSGDFLPLLVVFVIGLALYLAVLRKVEIAERQLLTLSFAAHVASAAAQVIITKYIYGYGDMITYHYQGVDLANLLRYDFARFFPDVIALIGQQDVVLPVTIAGVGGSTGAMSGLAGLACFFLNDSLWAICLLIAVFAWLGKIGFYFAFRERVDRALRQRVMFGVMLVPSAVFWTCGLLKEGIAMTGMGAMLHAVWCYRSLSKGRALMQIGAGALIVGLTKGYVLFAFVVASGAWLYWDLALARTGRALEIRPVHLVLVGGVMFVGITLLGQIFPEYDLEQVAEHTAQLQELGQRMRGGSNYQIVDTPRRGLAAQLAFAPVALLTALFRPTLPEVRNGLMLINAMETTIVMVLFVRAVVKQSWAVLWHRLRSSAPLAFCIVFTMVFGVAVGLATTNLGSLSRYRAPLMPFFVTLVLLWTAPSFPTPSAPPQPKRVAIRMRSRRPA